MLHKLMVSLCVLYGSVTIYSLLLLRTAAVRAAATTSAVATVARTQCVEQKVEVVVVDIGKRVHVVRVRGVALKVGEWRAMFAPQQRDIREGIGRRSNGVVCGSKCV